MNVECVPRTVAVPSIEANNGGASFVLYYYNV